MYSATIDLVAECQKWLRNVAYLKTDGRMDVRTDGRTDGPTSDTLWGFYIVGFF